MSEHFSLATRNKNMFENPKIYTSVIAFFGGCLEFSVITVFCGAFFS